VGDLKGRIKRIAIVAASGGGRRPALTASAPGAANNRARDEETSPARTKKLHARKTGMS
jgi:hypothetical protein